MKLMHEQIDFPGKSVVKVKVQERESFTYPWHFHSEYEIMYVLEGFGTRFVADSIEEFQAGDFVMLACNLPHFWKSDVSYYEGNNKKQVRYIVLQLPNEFFREALDNYPEFYMIKELLKKSGRGVCFTKEFADKVRKKVMKVARSDGFDRLSYMLQLLQLMAKSNEYRLLAGEYYQLEKHDFTSNRLTKVMHYLNTNYLKKVELKDVASVANMHPSAFCRYFKESSGKSLSEFVNEIRIGYACRLLLEGKMTVSQICFDSGFNNLSNFNRAFKKNTGYTPTSYFEKFQRK
ncbi:AraC family transcriptional regulator [Draconibacterium sediminis]|uniref:AraC family transcriptional regulator n=1 Tax=Draconibacterium sediminis TaxID=1544798 RepID=UPI0005D2E5E6|nr:AraC family transcriptional regulator [Draconibacterium sediminis]